MLEKQCLICKTKYYIYPYREKISKFCSFACNMKDKSVRFNDKRITNLKKVIIGNKYRLGIQAPNKGKTQIAWNKGIPHTQKTKDLISKKKKGIPSGKLGIPILSIRGKNHWNWKGGITSGNRVIRHSLEYKQWRLKVLQRDKFSCVKCGYKSKKRKDIIVDHIKPFCKFPKLRLDINNGRTLCIHCDKKFGWNNFRTKNEK